MKRPNILFVMTDQQRFDTIAALGNRHIYTPNLDRLVRRGITFTHAYSTCPVCVPARCTVRTGCEPPSIRIFTNGRMGPAAGQAQTIEGRCGPYLARTMDRLGYRTFGIGKFHTQPWNEDVGFRVQLHSEEMYGSPEQRRGDAFASWIARQHRQFDYIEALMGERTEMYYMPQVSPLPPELTVESWAADRAVEQINVRNSKPWFGFVSFVGPHPPFAPPIPFNRMYDPDRMPDPVCGDLATDHMDEQIPWMNRIIWADDISKSHARALKARYFGEISYIDDCLGRILDAVEKRRDADNTLICFFSDHGDHMGDHHAWQKESFFDACARIPFLVSWPASLPLNRRRDDLVCLTDLFGIATTAAGKPDLREGVDVLGALEGRVAPRSRLIGWYGEPGTPLFKMMLRTPQWKYIFMANGNREQLFNVRSDPFELTNLARRRPTVTAQMRETAVAACRRPGAEEALGSADLKVFRFRERPRGRIYQFDCSRGVTGFPRHPGDVLRSGKQRG